MPVLTTFGGAAARSFGRGIEQVPAALPANTVLFYNITNSTIQGSTPNASWTIHNTGNKYIIGTATQIQIDTAQPNGSGTASLIGTTGTGGAHSGSTTFVTSPYNATGTYTNYANGAAGSHTHGLQTASVATALANTITITTITNSVKQTNIPAGCIVFRKTAPTSLNFTALSLPGTGYFYGSSSAANTTWTNRVTEGAAIATGVSTSGSHYHFGGSTYYYWGPGAYSSYGYAGAGNHGDHGFNFNVEMRIKSRYLSAWVSTVDEPIEYGMIVLYRGLLTDLPAGWRVCDGTLGTPDMQDHALIWASTGVTHGGQVYSANSATVQGTQTGFTTTSSWWHDHQSVYSTNRGSNGWHANSSNGHAHSFSVTSISTSSYSPPYHRLAFIQYKGI